MVTDAQITKLEKAVKGITEPKEEDIRRLILGCAGVENQILHSRSISRDLAGKPFLEMQVWGPEGDIMPGLKPIKEKHIPAMEDFKDFESEFHCTSFNWGLVDTEAYEAYRRNVMVAYAKRQEAEEADR